MGHSNRGVSAFFVLSQQRSIPQVPPAAVPTEKKPSPLSCVLPFGSEPNMTAIYPSNTKTRTIPLRYPHRLRQSETLSFGIEVTPRKTPPPSATQKAGEFYFILKTLTLYNDNFLLALQVCNKYFGYSGHQCNLEKDVDKYSPVRKKALLFQSYFSYLKK